MLEALTTVRWHLETQPGWNAHDEVSLAIRGLALATEETGDAAYSRMLYAIGNNHAGTYFPVVLAVIPFLGEILRAHECSNAARGRALDVLIDLVGSFEPEPGFERVPTADGVRPLRELLKERTIHLKADLEAACNSPGLAKLANELLALLRE